MNANGLNRRVAIWKYDRSENAAGTPIEQWIFHKYTYANIKIDNGNKQSNDPPGNLPTTNVTITVRYDKEIDYNCQVRYNGQVYTITYIQEDYRKNFYNLKCTTYNEYQ